ncbi:MAG: glycosyltransferase [Microgenomates group bacterium]
MRLVISNPQVHLIGRTLLDLVISRKGHKKYSFFITEYILSKNRDVAFIVDGSKSSLNGIGIRFVLLSKVISYIELLIWMIINNINPLKVKVYFNVDNLNPKKDIILNYSHSTIDGSYVLNNNNMQFHKYDGVVLTHLTHYFVGTNHISKYLSSVKNSFLLAENDISHNMYFMNFFPDVKSVYQLPFTLSPRFKDTQTFSDRSDKCMAVGTISQAITHPLNDYFGKGQNLHPMRKTLYDNRKISKYQKQIEFLLYLYDDINNLKTAKKNDSFVTKICKKYLPYFILEKFYPNFLNKYFSFNIVEKYNSYKMFISPEEIVGLPSVNVFEGMACGCAYIGLEDDMYKRIGMINGLNYISYDGSFSMLIEKIKYYQRHQNELERIAINGRNYVLEQFSEKNISDIFWTDMDKLLKSFNKGGANFTSSFVKRAIRND